MERFKEIARKLLHPHWALTLLLCLGSGAGLAWIFLNGHEMAWFAYPIYVLSFYALTAACVVLVPKLIRLAKVKREHDAKQDKTKQLRNSLYQNLLVNLGYGLIQMFLGAVTGSVWVGSNGLYNFVHGLAHAVLVHYENKLEKLEDRQQRLTLAWRCYRICGYVLFALNLTMTGIAFQMIWKGEGDSYSEIMVIAVAAFTFYKLTVAIIGVFQCRKNNSPILGAARNMALTEALMTLFSLQTALFASYGQDFDQQFLMNSLTGGAICLMTVLGGLGMVIHGKKRSEEITGEMHHGK